MAKVGRKKWVPSAEDLENIRKYAANLLKEEDIARVCGIGPSTFTEKKKEFPELIEAIKEGRARAATLIGNKLMKVGITDEHPTMLIFLAKSIMGLRENDPLVGDHYTVSVHGHKGKEDFSF